MRSTCLSQGITDCNRNTKHRGCYWFGLLIWLLLVLFCSLIPLRLCAFLFFALCILGLSYLDFLPFLVQTALENTSVRDTVEIMFMLAAFFMCLPHSSPWKEVPRGLQSVGSQRVKHDEQVSISQYHTSTYAGWWGWCNEWVKLMKHEVCWEVAKSQQVISLSSDLCCCGFSVEHYRGGCPFSSGRLSLLPLVLVLGRLCSYFLKIVFVGSWLTPETLNMITGCWWNWISVQV